MRRTGGIGRKKLEHSHRVVTVYLSEMDLEFIEILIKKGLHTTRSEVVRNAVGQFIRREIKRLYQQEEIIIDPEKLILDEKEFRIIGEA